ncbi:FecR family protein [Rubrolithibacter danxiaensis]|uniref:FecR family protein n=1 Tax=Rubrolithibacter danxiaensis TaxID=3390805 RepID=UPI003BF90CED
MDKQYFLVLLHKYLKGKATSEEQSFLISYYNLFQNEPDVTALLTDEKKEELKKQLQDSIWNTISEEEQSYKKIRAIKTILVRTAVAAVLVAICTVGLYFLNVRKDEALTPVTVSNFQKGDQIIHLPDGSTVILSSGSKLQYPSSFTSSSKREVNLDGGAFFDISHNPSKPFVVHTGKVQTTVLGTAFSVEAFSWERDITVTVSRGKVKVSDQHKMQGIITPDQQIKYNRFKAVSSKKNVDAAGYTNWKGLNLIFDDITVAEAAALLQNKFAVAIRLKDNFSNSKRFTATFNRDESLEHILKSICEFNGASYFYDKQKALVIIKSTRPAKPIKTH